MRLYDTRTRTTRDFEPLTPGRVGIYVCGPTVQSPPHVGHARSAVAFDILRRWLTFSGFDVRSFPSYGALSGQQPDNMLAAADDSTTKRDPLDFALWKGAKSDEPAWDTPWGAGRPGWHLECSAMVTRYLGPEFDIHGGGLDLLFPHHENEVAQSNAAGDAFARYWMHNGMVNTGGEKMSKSLGNSLVVADVLQRARPQAVRYYLGSAHYRSDLDWSEDGLAESEAAYARIEGFLARAAEVIGDHDSGVTLPAEFVDAMNDDLGVPRALGLLHETVRAGNTALSEGDKDALLAAYTTASAVTQILGLAPHEFSSDGADHQLRAVIDGLVPAMLGTRDAARSRKDFAEADRIRDALTEAGIVIEDTPAGPRWRLA